MIPLYGILTPAALAVARALRSADDAAELYRRIQRHDLGGQRFSRLFERACFHHAAGHGSEVELLAKLAGARSPLHSMAIQLAELPAWILDAAGTPAELATVVVYGPRAFRPPHSRSAAA
jgi:hypothetical protein